MLVFRSCLCTYMSHLGYLQQTMVGGNGLALNIYVGQFDYRRGTDSRPDVSQYIPRYTAMNL